MYKSAEEEQRSKDDVLFEFRSLQALCNVETEGRAFGFTEFILVGGVYKSEKEAGAEMRNWEACWVGGVVL